MLTEADTCRKYVVLKLQGAGWVNKPHSIAGRDNAQFMFYEALRIPPISRHGKNQPRTTDIRIAELDALQAGVDALKRLQAETAAELDALLPAILDRAFKREL
jgi:hypothetical protein